MGTHHITIKQSNLTAMFQEKHRKHLGRRGLPSPTETGEPDAHPLPVTWRLCSAARMPTAAKTPALRSEIGTAVEHGVSLPVSPTKLMMPLIAWAIRSKPPRSR